MFFLCSTTEMIFVYKCALDLLPFILQKRHEKATQKASDPEPCFKFDTQENIHFKKQSEECLFV